MVLQGGDNMLTIKFTDGELVSNVDWNSLPNNKVIRYMDYTIGNQTIRLMGYDRYLRLKEMVQGVNVNLKGMSKVILIGQTGILCDKITIDLITKKISKEQTSFDIIYNKPIDDKFWRVGEKLNNPNIFIRNN
jgi:hypothetical protein